VTLLCTILGIALWTRWTRRRSPCPAIWRSAAVGVCVGIGCMLGGHGIIALT